MGSSRKTHPSRIVASEGAGRRQLPIALLAILRRLELHSQLLQLAIRRVNPTLHTGLQCSAVQRRRHDKRGLAWCELTAGEDCEHDDVSTIQMTATMMHRTARHGTTRDENEDEDEDENEDEDEDENG